MTDDPIFSKSASVLNSHIALSKLTGALKFRELERDTIVLFSYRVNEAFCCIKGLCGMKN